MCAECSVGAQEKARQLRRALKVRGEAHILCPRPNAVKAVRGLPAALVCRTTAELYVVRDPLYREVADHVVESDRDAVLRFVRALEADAFRST